MRTVDWKDLREEERSFRRASGSLLDFICTEENDGLLLSFMLVGVMAI